MKAWSAAVAPGIILCAVVAALFFWKVPETELDRAVALLHANKHAAAVPMLEAIARKEPDNTEVFPWLAQGYLHTDRIAEGRTALDTALKLKLPAKLVVPVVLAYAEYYQNKNDFTEAEKIFASALPALAPTAETSLASPRAHLYVAWADADIALMHYQDAVSHLEQANTLKSKITGPGNDPTIERIPHQLAECYRQMAALAEVQSHDDKKAIALLQASLAACDEPLTRMALANIFARTGDTEHAIANYMAVRQSDSNNLEARHKLIELHLRARNLECAQEALLELTERERSVENFELLANIDMQLENYAGAVRAIQQALLLRPKDVALLKRQYQALDKWSIWLMQRNKVQEAASVKAQLERVDDLLKEVQNAELLKALAAERMPGPGIPPVTLAQSRIWLARGSLTPEGEVKLSNVSGQAVTDLSLTMVFYDNTSRRKLSAVTVSAASPEHPMEPGTSRSLYFSCPTTVRTDHQLAVIIFWKDHLFKELPVVKER